MWPDVGIKSCNFFSERSPKRIHSSFYLKVMIFKVAKNVMEDYLVYFWKDFCCQELLQSPNLVTLVGGSKRRLSRYLIVEDLSKSVMDRDFR